MIGKFVVIDTLDNFKSKLDSIPSSAIVLIKDVGQIYAHGTYFGARNTCELLNQEAAGLAPAGGINANGQISNVDTEWVLTVTNGKDPVWKKLPANAFANNSAVLEAATDSTLGGIKVGSVYNGLFSTLTGKHYTVNIDSNGLAYVSVPWDFTDQNVKQTVTSLLNEDFSLLFSHTADDSTHTEGTRKASNLKFNPSTGTLTTTILKGNLDGNYINKLTGYSKAKSAAAITASDTLKTALGKLEYKTDVVYDLVDASKPDSTTIDTLREVLNVLSGITDTQTIQGILGNYLPLTGGTLTNNAIPLNINRTGSDVTNIRYYIDDEELGSLGFTKQLGLAVYLTSNPGWYKIWNEANFNPSDYLLKTGGDLSGLLSIQRDAAVPLQIENTAKTNSLSQTILRFRYNGSSISAIGAKTDGKLYRYNADLSSAYTIWDSNNDGSGSGLDADTLDGLHKNDIVENQWNPTIDLNTIYAKTQFTETSYNNAGSANITNLPFEDVATTVITTPGRYGFQIAHQYNSATAFKIRGFYNTTFYSWKTLAFTDSNVASATKLKTARSLWGNSFDGSSDLSGDIIISKTTNSSASGGKITLRGYYSAESANWDAVIASDYYGANYCSEAGFSHGMIFKGGRSGFDSFIFIDSSSNPVARISKVFSNYFKNNTEIEGTLNVTGNITMSSGIATNWSDTSVDSNNKARPWYGLSYSDVTNANNMMLSGYYGITYRTGSTAMNHVFKGGHVRPDTNGTQTLGTSSYKWNNVYSTTFTGNLDGNITKGTPQLCSAVESDEITIKENSNGVISTNKPNDGAALRKAINFRWYDTNWQIGNIRGSASNSGGFGITYGNNNLCFRVTTDGCYANGSKILTEANANLGNADTVDNYHIVVTSSPGTNTSTIYFVT